MVERACRGGCMEVPSMKVPPKRKGNRLFFQLLHVLHGPSMKVPPKRKGNHPLRGAVVMPPWPSMKVPPKRKGNRGEDLLTLAAKTALNESPSEKEGKYSRRAPRRNRRTQPSMKVPPKRKGNPYPNRRAGTCRGPSMKVPPKRKGNARLLVTQRAAVNEALNESPSEKEGKCTPLNS